MAALITGDHRKAEELGRRYGIDRIYHYDAYRAALDSGGFDAAYVAPPDWLLPRDPVLGVELGLANVLLWGLANRTAGWTR